MSITSRNIGSSNRIHQASLWRLISTAELAMENIQAAREALAQAQDILAFRMNSLELGRTHAQAARIALALEDCSAMDAHLKSAQETFIKLGAELDLVQIQNLVEYRI